jgi:hypothetical protein
MDEDFKPTFAPESPSQATTAPEDETAECTAETAECTCPDFCERDHANE